MKLLNGKAMIVSVGCSFVLASVMIALGFLHNAQSEFYLPDGSIDYKFSLGLFAVWFFVGVTVGLTMYFLFSLLVKLLS